MAPEDGALMIDLQGDIAHILMPAPKRTKPPLGRRLFGMCFDVR
jgi:hypothetical protein